jgi:hypothetical protein
MSRLCSSQVDMAFHLGGLVGYRSPLQSGSDSTA